MAIDATIRKVITMRDKTFYCIKDMIKHIGVKWDELAPDKDKAREYAHAHINQEPKRMIDNNRYSMEYCLAHSGEIINERYRENRADNIDLQIAEMVATHTTDTDLVLYRGVCDYVYDLMKKMQKI